MAKQEIQDQSQQDLSVSKQTMDFFGLKQQPFTLSILSDNSNYTDPILDKLFDTLTHHLQFSELLLIVEGDYGSGKTTLFRRLFQIGSSNLFLLPIQAEATDTLIQLQQKLSIHLQDQGDANHLEDNLKHLQVFDQTPVLIIDDAHILTDTTLQELLRFKQSLQNEFETTLKILLLSNKGMAKTLEQISDLDHSQLYVQEMPAFTAKQVHHFIQHRLKIAGAKKPAQFDEKTLLEIAKRSKGLPSQIMKLATKPLNKQARKKASLSLPAVPKRMVMLSAIFTLVAVLAVANYLFYSNEQAPSIQQPEQVLPASINHNAPESDKPLYKQDTSPDLAEVNSVTDNNEVTTDLTTTEIVEDKITPEQEEIGQPLSEPVISQKEDIAPPVITDLNSEPSINKPEEQKPLVEAITAPAKIETPSIEKDKTITPAPVAPPKITKTVTPVPAPSIVKPVTSPAFKQLAKMNIKNSNWLKKQKPGNWTLQILGAREPETLTKFARQHRLGKDSAWFETSLSGKPWYVLVHRFYTNRDIARNEISRLPRDLRMARPWVRSLGSIHQAMK